MHSIGMLDYLIHHHLTFAQGMQDKVKLWKDVGKGNPKSMGISIAETHIEIAKSLELVKETVLKERKAPNCKHVKKDRDISHNGVVYCMNCNSDLPEELSPKKKK